MALTGNWLSSHFAFLKHVLLLPLFMHRCIESTLAAQHFSRRLKKIQKGKLNTYEISRDCRRSVLPASWDTFYALLSGNCWGRASGGVGAWQIAAIFFVLGEKREISRLWGEHMRSIPEPLKQAKAQQTRELKVRYQYFFNVNKINSSHILCHSTSAGFHSLDVVRRA